jgi:hypothetical protein
MLQYCICPTLYFFVCRQTFSEPCGLLISLGNVIRRNMSNDKVPEAMLQRILEDAARAGVRSYLEELETDKTKRGSVVGTHFSGCLDQEVRKHALKHYMTKSGMPNAVLRSIMKKEGNQGIVVALLYGELKSQVECSRLPGSCPYSSNLLAFCDVTTSMMSSQVLRLRGSVTNGSHL